MRNQVGSYQLADGRWLTSGLGVGSSDLIGWNPVTIGGHRVAVFTAIEVKMPGRNPSPQQIAFLDAVSAAGGIAILAHSVEEARERLLRYQHGR